MSQSISGRVALITGAARGQGREAEWITGQVWYIGGGSHLRQ